MQLGECDSLNHLDVGSEETSEKFADWVGLCEVSKDPTEIEGSLDLVFVSTSSCRKRAISQMRSCWLQERVRWSRGYLER